MVLIVLCYALLASTFTLAKATLEYAKPFFVIGFRMTIAGSIMLGYLFLFQRKYLTLNKNDIFPFLRVAFFHVYLAFTCEFWALQYVTSSKTCLIYALTPLIAAILAYMLLNERLGMKKVIGLCLGFAGMIPILIIQSAPGELGMNLLRISLPEMILLVAVVSATYAWFGIKDLMGKGHSLIMVNGFAMLIGGLAVFATSAIFEGFSPLPISNVPLFLKYVFALILASNILFYNFYGWLLKKYSITFLTFVGFLTPIFAAGFGWFFLGEQITWHYGISLIAITSALYLFYKEESQSALAQPMPPRS